MYHGASLSVCAAGTYCLVLWSWRRRAITHGRELRSPQDHHRGSGAVGGSCRRALSRPDPTEVGKSGLRAQAVGVVTGSLEQRARDVGPDPEDVDEGRRGRGGQAGDLGLENLGLLLEVLEAAGEGTEGELRRRKRSRVATSPGRSRAQVRTGQTPRTSLPGAVPSSFRPCRRRRRRSMRSSLISCTPEPRSRHLAGASPRCRSPTAVPVGLAPARLEVDSDRRRRASHLVGVALCSPNSTPRLQRPTYVSIRAFAVAGHVSLSGLGWAAVSM